MRRVWIADIMDGYPFTHKRAKVVRVDDLRIPIHIALGAYESASTEELDDLITDLQAERARR